MPQFREQHQQTLESAATRKAEDEAAMREIGDLFKTPEGKKVLTLLARRFGLLHRRYRKNDRGEVNAIRAGIHDGEAAVVLFLIECLQRAGETELTLPLT